MSDFKRWQFTLRGIIAYMALVCMAAGAWPLAIRSEWGFASSVGVVVAIFATAGAVLAPFYWLTTGRNATGFLVAAFAVVVLTLVLLSTVLSVIRW